MKKRGCLRSFMTLFCIVCVVVAAGAFLYYNIFYKPNTTTPDGKKTYLYIPSQATYTQLLDSLRPLLIHETTFERAARVESLSDRVHPGRYAVSPGMGNKPLVRKLAMGWQDPLNVTLAGRIRTPERLAALLTRRVEADSAAFLACLRNKTLIDSLGFNANTIMGMFIPNTYEVLWTISPKGLMERMNREYHRFWNDERQAKASAIGLTPKQVSTLASIVCEETNKTDEMPVVAGVYMNRLHKGIPLQADPTLIFAAQDFSIRRVLNRHKEVESPYNTYKYAGLPPGPICVPQIEALEAVLNYTHHNYLYFCAKEDFSGYHNFAQTLSQHEANARRFHAALNKQRP